MFLLKINYKSFPCQHVEEETCNCRAWRNKRENAMALEVCIKKNYGFFNLRYRFKVLCRILRKIKLMFLDP